MPKRYRRRACMNRMDFYDGMSLSCSYLQQMDALLDCLSRDDLADRRPVLLEAARSVTNYYAGHLQHYRVKAEKWLAR